MDEHPPLLARIRRKAVNVAHHLLHPPGRHGVSHNSWEAYQTQHELTYWTERYPKEVPPGTDLPTFYGQRYHALNAGMFTNLRLDCTGLRVVDVGCGPFGSLAYHNPAELIGVEPLAAQFQHVYPYPRNFTVLACQAEQIPLLDDSMDAIYCVNALDHAERPYRALEEIRRILRPGGYLALAVDVGGTPEHPCKLQEADLRAALLPVYEVIECRCSTEITTSWPADMQIPAFVFQGEKRSVAPGPR